MPFVKTEVDIKTDYTLETVDPDWLKQGVKSPKHLMLDPEPCILCRACEDVCPWNCIFMLDPGIVQETQTEPVADEIARWDEADYVVVTAGQFDIVAEVVAATRRELLDITNRMRALDDVVSTETFFYLEMWKQLYDWGTRGA